MKTLVIFIIIFCLTTNYAIASGEYKHFAIYYSDKNSLELLSNFELIVLDSQDHPDMDVMLSKGVTVLGYLSLGEVEKRRNYFNLLKETGLLSGQNKNWPDSYFIDVRNNLWAHIIIDKLVPDILHQGFKGIFIDTLDSTEELEKTNPRKYRGVKESAANIIKAIRLNYPDIKIMVNRGYNIFPLISNDIDMELAESVYTSYDFKTKKSHITDPTIYKDHLAILNNIKKINPKISIFTLDYWDIKDTDGISKIYQEERKNGFIPYVATIELDKVITEPRKK